MDVSIVKQNVYVNINSDDRPRKVYLVMVVFSCSWDIDLNILKMCTKSQSFQSYKNSTVTHYLLHHQSYIHK